MLHGGAAIDGPANVDDSGMYSIQVISMALQVFGLRAIPYESAELREEAGFDVLRERAFILNLQVVVGINEGGC